jgi:serine/threonine protein kinase
MRYTTIEIIGQGGFGIVDKVKDAKGKVYARKTFHLSNPFQFDAAATKNVRERFIREAKVQSSIKSKNVVPVLDHNLNSDPPYYIMPLADSTLAIDIISHRTLNGKFSEAIVDILSGLEELHGMGLYHRDLKPANVLRYADPKGKPYYAISDFGLMSLKQTNVTTLTKTGMRMQSDMYTAPEIVLELKNASAQSDIFSVGCILHDFAGMDDRIPCAEIKEPENPYSAILQMCTRKDRSRRFKSVSSLRDALLALGQVNLVPKTKQGKEIVELLAKEPTTLKEKDWLSIVEFIEDKFPDDDAKAVLMKLDIDHIESLIKGFFMQASRVGLVYAKWIRDGSFRFDDCDGLAIRTEKFMAINDVDLRAECLMALLYMGTGHNRWYVERKFVGNVTANMDDQLAKRLALEIRCDEIDACKAYSHLRRSISYDLGNLHPVIISAIKDVCK